MRHFDSHAYRTEDEDGVWAFAAGSMRNYLIFREKVHRFAADAEIQQLVNELASRGEAGGTGATGRLRFDADLARALRSRAFDLPSMRSSGFGYERLDQLTMELLLGVR
jgi:xylose isomerase